MKCDICGKKIEELFLNKINGTIIKIKEGDKNRTYYICTDCQKKYKDLKAELKKR